jgi:hypothetical protein
MKTRQETTQRHQSRDFTIAMLDLKTEFGEIAGDDILDELAFAEIMDDDE